MKKKKVLLLYATYGSGHKTIANSIAEELTKRNPEEYEILSIDFLDYANKVVDVVSNKVFEFANTKIPFIWESIYRLTNFQHSYKKKVMLAKFFNTKKLKKVITDFNPDLVISTIHYGSALISEYIEKEYIKTKLITVVADFKAHSVWLRNSKFVDAIIVNDEIEKIFFMKKGINSKKLKPFGIPIGDKFDFNVDKKKELKKLGLKNDYLTLLLHGYGVGGQKQTRNIKYLKHILENNIKINIIFLAGKNEETKEAAEKLKKKYKVDNLIVLGFIDNMHEILPLCDVNVSKAGTMTLRECLYCQIPMIIINGTPGQEKDNTTYLVKHGCAKRIRTKAGFKNYLHRLTINPFILKKMTENIQKISQKDSMDKLYELIINLLKK